jgi:hypothetical protein
MLKKNTTESQAQGQFARIGATFVRAVSAKCPRGNKQDAMKAATIAKRFAFRGIHVRARLS